MTELQHSSAIRALGMMLKVRDKADRNVVASLQKHLYNCEITSHSYSPAFNRFLHLLTNGGPGPWYPGLGYHCRSSFSTARKSIDQASAERHHLCCIGGANCARWSSPPIRRL
jgi:hypothetical protein